MGGGDLNMKKSWHPLLIKNQERVWLEEKKALEEKKKLDQLRKEKDEERQMQELQRLQEEKTGKKRQDKLDWMYATPASGSAQNPNDLEDYLLGKKRVDKILTGDENAKLGASHKNFIAVQNANSIRDIASKIREDPLLAIKQQEQKAYEALVSNPLRLREMQERNGIKPAKDKKERKREKKEKKERERREREEDEDRARRSRHRSPYRDDDDDYRSRRRHSRSRSPYDQRDRSRSPPRRSSYREDDYDRKGYDRDRHRNHDRSLSPQLRRDGHARQWPRSDESEEDDRRRYRDRSHERRDYRPRDYDDGGDRKRRRGSRSRSPYSNTKRSRPSPPPPPSYRDSVSNYSRPPPPAGPSKAPADADRAARLAAMTSNASGMEAERRERLNALLEKEKAEYEAEEAARKKSKGMASFLGDEQKKVYAGGEGALEDRIRRGRGGMVVDAD